MLLPFKQLGWRQMRGHHDIYVLMRVLCVLGWSCPPARPGLVGEARPNGSVSSPRKRQNSPLLRFKMRYCSVSLAT